MDIKKPIAIISILAALMAATRFNHFGSAIALPDASLAVFFLGGLYLARFSRASLIAFVILIFEAGLVDYYATSIQGVSDWCMTSAYWFLIPTYASLWLAGRWFALCFIPEGKGLLVLALTAWVASSFAFLLSNTAFYLFSEYFAAMSVAEYAYRVSQYYGSYVSVAMFYIACAVGVQLIFGIIFRQKVHHGRV